MRAAVPWGFYRKERLTSHRGAIVYQRSIFPETGRGCHDTEPRIVFGKYSIEGKPFGNYNIRLLAPLLPLLREKERAPYAK